MGYRILHALRFLIAGIFVIFLSVASVVVSLTGPSESQSNEVARSQETPNGLGLSTTKDFVERNEENDVPNQKAIESTGLPSTTQDKPQALDVIPTKKTRGEKIPEMVLASSSFIPNFVARGITAESAESFTPNQTNQVSTSPSIPTYSPPSIPAPDPPASSPVDPPVSSPVDPPVSSPVDPSPPVVNETFIPNVERWRETVIAAIAAYGGPSDEVDLFLTIMHRESRGLPDVTNPTSGAAGLMQHMPQYWDQRAINAGYSGESPYDPVANINVSAWLLYQAAGGGWGHWSTY